MDTHEFTEIVEGSNGVGELAAQISDIYSELERMITPTFEGEDRTDQEHDQATPAERDRDEARHESEADGSAVEDVTKEELLERAREANVHGRSSMSKEELAHAVEAEESLTKEELLERARIAGVEGRSSMTKDELRAALRDADA